MSAFNQPQRGFTRILNAFGYSLAGLRYAWVNEAAFRQLCWLNLGLITLAFCLDISTLERALLIAVTLAALVVELINSALEAVVDRISLQLHPLAKAAKDMGSAAQLLALLIIAATWGLVLLG